MAFWCENIRLFHYVPNIVMDVIIQLMHSNEVDIRICQPENSDAHQGEAEVNITFEGWLILMLTETECTNCFVI